MMDKPDVDSIEGLSPAIAIEQKASSHNPRSTVGTVTEIYDYLRLLYARAGMPRCPDHGIDLTAQTVSQMVDQVLRLPEGTAAAAARAAGRASARASTRRCSRSCRARASCACASTARSTRSRRCPKLDPQAQAHHRGGRRSLPRAARRRAAPRRVVRDRAAPVGRARRRLAFLEQPGARGAACSRAVTPARCAASRVPPLEPQLFSFNNPAGACPTCDGLGLQEFFDPAARRACIRTCRSRAARCAAGTAATPTTSS